MDKTSARDIGNLLGRQASGVRWRLWSVWGVAGLVILVVVTFLAWRGEDRGPAQIYLTETIERGDITQTVVANGTLEPTRSVEIGSELSGTVTRVLVDVNDRVTQGQVLVELDTAKLADQILNSRAALAAAEAGVTQAVASVQEARSNLARLEEVAALSDGKVPSMAELDAARATLDRALAEENSARASVEGAKAALSTDETNLSKSSIRSPIDGVVLTRAVDPGNAVAASLQAVTLFTIAEDLTRLRLRVNVDEADVGSVEPGQQAAFTVSAYPNREFPAQITRVAFGATMTDNVVTYVTDLDVDNTDLSLRPGMTATATIVAAERLDVLQVPNAALRFRPQLATAPAAAGPSGLVSTLMPRPPVSNRRRAARSTTTVTSTDRAVWVLRDSAAVPVPVTVGITDGRMTEITAGDLEPGMQVITSQSFGEGP